MNKTIALTISLCFLSSSLLAESSGWLFLRTVESTKPRALSASGLYSIDTPGCWYNPAVSARTNRPEIDLVTAVQVKGTTSGGSIMYALPITPKKRNLVLGAVFLDSGAETLYYISGGLESSRAVTLERDYAGFLSYSQALSKTASFGITLKYAQMTLAEAKSATAIAADAGLLFNPKKNVSFGIAAQNFGSASKFITAEEQLPSALYASAAYAFTNPTGKTSALIFALDGTYLLNDQKSIATAGFEYALKFASLNAGYRPLNDTSKFQAGFSITPFPAIEISYAYAPSLYLYDTHTIALKLKF